jgi:translation elongation factor P/translation initiation factor 5A
MYRECFEKIFLKKKIEKSKVKQIQKEMEMEKIIFSGKIILLTNQKSVYKVWRLLSDFL